MTFPSITDPNFVVSSNRDHAKESFKAQTGMERIVSVCGWEGSACVCGRGVHVCVGGRGVDVCGGRRLHVCVCV